MAEQQTYQICGNEQLLCFQKYCQKCASNNPYYDPSNLPISYNNNNQSRIKQSEPTKYAVQLARALHSKGPQSTIDFEHYSVLFDKNLGIMKGLFGEAAEIELKNAYNITATNFMKNLIFYGKPLIAKFRIVWIKDYESIVFHIRDFKKYFYRFGIYVEESEVKVECLGELEKIENILKERNKIKLQINQNKIHESELRRFGWLERWIQEDLKYLNWLGDWLQYDKQLLILS